MSPAWDRDEALDLAVRMNRSYRKCVGAFPGAEECTALIRAADILRAADAEIIRLRAKEEAAEKMAEAARPFAISADIARDALSMPASMANLEAVANTYTDWNDREALCAALAAWDASRGEGGR